MQGRQIWCSCLFLTCQEDCRINDCSHPSNRSKELCTMKNMACQGEGNHLIIITMQIVCKETLFSIMSTQIRQVLSSHLYHFIISIKCNLDRTKYLETGMALEFLGTGSAVSTPHRNVSSLALHFCGATWIFDCGDGTSRQLYNSSVRPGKIECIFITHLHGDHVSTFKTNYMFTLYT